VIVEEREPTEETFPEPEAPAEAVGETPPVARMEREASGPDKRPAVGERRRRHFGRRKVCKFCADKVGLVDYKDVRRLRSLVTERGKIIPRRISGNCALHQRQVAGAIKRARMLAILPYTVASA